MQQLRPRRTGAAPTAPSSRARAPLSFSSSSPRRQRRHVVVAAAAPIETDAASRVAGTPAAVADYLSRVDETWPAWYPRLVSATRRGGSSGGNSGSNSAPPPVGTKWEVVVRAAGGGGGLIPAIDLPVTVQLLERSSKRVAFCASSPFHEVREQYVLMPCPADPQGGHTAVRHVSEVRLRGAWAGALAAPVVGGIMRAAPREALARLEAALRDKQQRQRQQRQGAAAAGGGAAAGRAADGGGGGPFWKGLFGGSGSGSGRSSSSSPDAAATTTASSNGDSDPHGLYAALGLARGAEDAAVRAAYRERAKRLHPDANVGADAASASASGEEFARVQRAYAVLRDAEARRRYDRGEWWPDEEGDGGRS